MEVNQLELGQVKIENKLKVVNECKITRERWTRRIVNKREEKEYQVVFDKRIVLGKGEDTIPYGFHWSPSTVTSTISHTVNQQFLTICYTL